LWRTILTRTEDFFSQEYRHLKFHDFLQLQANVTIPDEIWFRSDEQPEDVDEDEIDVLL